MAISTICFIRKPSTYENTDNFNLANSELEEMRSTPWKISNLLIWMN